MRIDWNGITLRDRYRACGTASRDSRLAPR
jgi:hypothetical protein